MSFHAKYGMAGGWICDLSVISVVSIILPWEMGHTA